MVFGSSTFCKHYDMRPHATKVLQDIVNALNGFVQASFMQPDPAGGEFCLQKCLSVHFDLEYLSEMVLP